MNMEAALRQRINNMRGRDITLVVHKQLSRTDVCPGHDRLKLYSAPTLERLARKFLTEDEEQRVLEHQIIDVPTVGPNLEDTELALTVQSKTTTLRQSGGNADETICVLRRGWSEVVAKYGLQKVMWCRFGRSGLETTTTTMVGGFTWLSLWLDEARAGFLVYLLSLTGFVCWCG